MINGWLRMNYLRLIALSFIICHLSFSPARAQFTLVELNCENLFDCRHDSLKQDSEWLPGSDKKWSPGRYWRKLNYIGQEILSCLDDGLPDLVALVEVENDSVARDLTRRSLLRGAGYDYLMTESPDVRGIDVALLYQPFKFRPLCYDNLVVQPLEGMRPTRDILYVKGETQHGDTLHVFVVHAPSRYGGEKHSRPFRLQVVDRLARAIAQLPAEAKVVVAGDFNDDADGPALQHLTQQGLQPISRQAAGRHGLAKASYRYQGRWQSIDHILASASLAVLVDEVYVNDASFLLEEDKKYGGHKPHRTYVGPRYQRGFSDHLPLVVRFRWPGSK
jgi:endonuclease/exonuclease/phosphatase family metal-dependent hydrolase